MPRARTRPPVLIKGQTLQAWRDWLTDELTPPIVAKPETKYVLEAMLELIELTIRKKETTPDANI